MNPANHNNRNMPSNSHIMRGGSSGGSDTGIPLKPLYMGKSIDDLNTQAKVKHFIILVLDSKVIHNRNRRTLRYLSILPKNLPLV